MTSHFRHRTLFLGPIELYIVLFMFKILHSYVQKVHIPGVCTQLNFQPKLNEPIPPAGQIIVQLTGTEFSVGRPLTWVQTLSAASFFLPPDP